MDPCQTYGHIPPMGFPKPGIVMCQKPGASSGSGTDWKALRVPAMAVSGRPRVVDRTGVNARLEKALFAVLLKGRWSMYLAVIAALFLAFASPSFANGAAAPTSGEGLANQIEQLRLEQQDLRKQLTSMEDRLQALVNRVDTMSQQPLDKKIVESMKRTMDEAASAGDRMLWLVGALFLLILVLLGTLWWKMRNLEQRLGP